ncbi:hypothetical protein OIU85_003849, partial [Salix viminalis]
DGLRPFVEFSLLSFGESIAQSISESSHQHNHPQKPIHGYDGSRMIPFGRPARRFGIIYVSAQLVNMVDNSSLDLQNVCCSGTIIRFGCLPEDHVIVRRRGPQPACLQKHLLVASAQEQNYGGRHHPI